MNTMIKLLSAWACVTICTTAQVMAGGVFSGTLFYETFDNLDGWVEESPGTFSSDGDNLYRLPTTGTNSISITKQLPLPLLPGYDFVFEVHVVDSTDTTGAVDWVNVKLLTDDDEEVAYIGWYDVKASAGWGGTDLCGEGGCVVAPIYRCSVSGSCTEDPVVDLTLRITRSGDQWGAWRDQQKPSVGSYLSLAPTLTATKVEITFPENHPDGWTVRDPKVDYLLIKYGRLCGDLDGNSDINVVDLTTLVDYLFKGGPAPCH